MTSTIPVVSSPSFWKAKYDFTGNPSENQLSFGKGDTFVVTQQHEGGWFTAQRNGQTGYVPSNYLERISSDKTSSRPVAAATAFASLRSTTTTNTTAMARAIVKPAEVPHPNKPQMQQKSNTISDVGDLMRKTAPVTRGRGRPVAPARRPSAGPPMRQPVTKPQLSDHKPVETGVMLTINRNNNNNNSIEDNNVDEEEEGAEQSQITMIKSGLRHSADEVASDSATIAYECAVESVTDNIQIEFEQQASKMPSLTSLNVPSPTRSFVDLKPKQSINKHILESPQEQQQQQTTTTNSNSNNTATSTVASVVKETQPSNNNGGTIPPLFVGSSMSFVQTPLAIVSPTVHPAVSVSTPTSTTTTTTAGTTTNSVGLSSKNLLASMPPPSIPSVKPTLFIPPDSASIPPIPLRTDLGESENPPIPTTTMDTGTDDDSVEGIKLLKTGNFFMKHMKRGKPVRKLFQMSEALDRIVWKDPDPAKKKADDGSLIIDDIIAIVKGHTTSGRKNPRGPVANSPLAISIICSDEAKTLDLDAETTHIRDKWFNALETVLKARAYARLESQ